MDYDNPVKQRVSAFHQRHGPECYSDGAAYYYADGAVRDVNPVGALIEPPGVENASRGAEATRDEYQRVSNIVRFFKLKLRAAVREFDELNTRLAHTVPNDPDAEIARLRRLQKIVQERKEMLNKAEQGLADTVLGRHRAQKLKEDEEARQRIADFQHQRKLVRI